MYVWIVTLYTDALLCYLSLQSKKLKGVTRKSIFATPEAVNGRVGIGTCGIGGKPMTDYTLAEKRRRGM